MHELGTAERKSTPHEQARRQHPALWRRRISAFFSNREVRALALVMLMAFLLRVVWLDTIPGNITADEADNLATIFRFQTTGEPGFFGLDWKPQPAMSMYLFAGFMAIFGDDIFGMRMASAVISTLALIPFYALARRVVQPAAAIGGAILLSTGLWYLNFSRSGWENVHVAFYALMAAWMLALAVERRQIRWFALAGVFAALGLYGYFAGRLIIVALLAYAPLALWWSHGKRLVVAAGFAVMLLTAAVLFAPQVPAITEDSDTFNRRTDAVNVFEQPNGYMGKESRISIMKLQIERNAKGFFLFDGDVFTNGRYSQPGSTIIDPITKVLLLAGMVIGIYRWKQTALWWLLMLIPLAATQLLTTMTPNGARALIVAPFMYLFVTLTLDAFINAARFRERRIMAGVVLTGVVLLAVVNAMTYFDWVQSPETLQAREPAVQLDDYELWREAMISELEKDRRPFHLGDWNDMVDDLRERQMH